MADFDDELLCSDDREVWDEDGDRTREEFRGHARDPIVELFHRCEFVVMSLVVVEGFKGSKETRSNSASLHDWEQ